MMTHGSEARIYGGRTIWKMFDLKTGMYIETEIGVLITYIIPFSKKSTSLNLNINLQINSAL